VSECEFTHLVGHSLGRKLLFVFPLTNTQLDLTKRKMSSNGSANVKHSEDMSDKKKEKKKIRAFARPCVELSPYALSKLNT